MLKKIITKNVGVLRAFDTPGAPQLAKLTTIYARNGRGKTTLSAILRAAGNGDDSIVKGRQTLGNGGAAPEVTLIFDNGGTVRFTAGKWTAKSAPIEVFDAAFIADNLYAGEKIDLEHDRKLFTVILGRQGVKLQRQQEVFNAAAKVTGATLKAAEAALADDAPTDMTREEFLGSAPSADIDDQIDQATKELKAVQEAGRLAKLKLLDTVAVPTLSIDVPAVLAGKRRGEAGVQGRVDTMLAAKRRDARARRARTAVQDRLKKVNETAAAHYHERVNHYLEKFGATFRISEISNSMAGNLGSVDYGLIVRGHPISRGRKGATDAEPTFKNTLSSGDKTTLAFAFFLAGLDRDAGLTDKIVVFDDPLSSHDIHRQNRTVEFLNHLCGRCEQVIVMSHDAHFLRRASTRCPLDQASYEIIFEGPEQWSKARVANLDDLCRSSNDVLIDHLQTYHDKKLGDPTQIAPAVRKVLETHYRRSFSAYFGRRDYLGTIITKIRDGDPSHPCYADLPDLESCNAATTDEHHGDDSEVAPTAPIDPDDLHLVVRDCLQLIGALRRSMPGVASGAATSSMTTPVTGTP